MHPQRISYNSFLTIKYYSCTLTRLIQVIRTNLSFILRTDNCIYRISYRRNHLLPGLWYCRPVKRGSANFIKEKEYLVLIGASQRLACHRLSARYGQLMKTQPTGLQKIFINIFLKTC